MKMKDALMDQMEEVSNLIQKLHDLIELARVEDNNLYEMTVFSLSQITTSLEEFLGTVSEKPSEIN